ncbi:MAG: hypothetical protein A2W94_15710 [Bacteroidetes bacterium GWE2_42_42]|nr:MAG: hypothetical protein A2W94_15710 [Bacteroidetes bacterium GWE2_42_42]
MAQREYTMVSRRESSLVFLAENTETQRGCASGSRRGRYGAERIYNGIAQRTLWRRDHKKKNRVSLILEFNPARGDFE